MALPTAAGHYSNHSSECRPSLTLQYNTYYVGFTSFGASIMNKVETECALLSFYWFVWIMWLCSLWFEAWCVCARARVCVWICFSRIVQSHAFSFSSKTNWGLWIISAFFFLLARLRSFHRGKLTRVSKTKSFVLGS